jgi:hypothetical protein
MVAVLQVAPHRRHSPRAQTVRVPTNWPVPVEIPVETVRVRVETVRVRVETVRVRVETVRVCVETVRVRVETVRVRVETVRVRVETCQGPVDSVRFSYRLSDSCRGCQILV